jgi:hypothetical protein
MGAGGGRWKRQSEESMDIEIQRIAFWQKQFEND